MVTLKNKAEIELMKEAGRISAAALRAGGEAVRPGVTTAEINKAVHDYIISQGAKPAFLGYGGFPGTACVSVNNEIIHGIPGKRVIREGDLVSIDTGAIYKGYYGDNAFTYACGEVSPEAKQLMEATQEALRRGIAAARPGNRLGDIGHAVQSYVEQFGYGVVREFVGHGIGTHLHESPDVPNFGTPGRGLRLIPGMTIAIEPMVNLKGIGVKVLPDGWTTVTQSGSISVHYENTILITDGDPIILTRP